MAEHFQWAVPSLQGVPQIHGSEPEVARKYGSLEEDLGDAGCRNCWPPRPELRVGRMSAALLGDVVLLAGVWHLVQF